MRVATILLIGFSVLISFSVKVCAGDILPKDWLSPGQLEQAENPIQQQLDTGRGMAGTAWDMAAVKDARLLLLYITLYERLPDEASRKKLYSEQTAWLARRRKAVAALDDPEGGSIVRVEKAATHMELTDKRIAELQKRLKQ